MSNFQQELKLTADKVNAFLKSYFNNQSADNKLYEAMEYGLFSGGKMIRSYLVQSTCKIFDIDEKKYINLFSEDAIFFGTDISERWSKNEFKLYVRSRFDTGTGWTYKPINRNIFISKNEKVAWFDEILFNEKYGEFRGTGVLIIENGKWKISQYNLLLPIPNDFLQKYANEIKEHYIN